jgi:hypothetical protein
MGGRIHEEVQVSSETVPLPTEPRKKEEKEDEEP